MLLILFYFFGGEGAEHILQIHNKLIFWFSVQNMAARCDPISDGLVKQAFRGGEVGCFSPTDSPCQSFDIYKLSQRQHLLGVPKRYCAAMKNILRWVQRLVRTTWANINCAVSPFAQHVINWQPFFLEFRLSCRHGLRQTTVSSASRKNLSFSSSKRLF